jgi:hypothetical protein
MNGSKIQRKIDPESSEPVTQERQANIREMDQVKTEKFWDLKQRFVTSII